MLTFPSKLAHLIPMLSDLFFELAAVSMHTVMSFCHCDDSLPFTVRSITTLLTQGGSF